MIYRAIGLMSGSSLDGLDIAFVEFHENGGKWNYELLEAECYPYSQEWISRLEKAITLPALDYQLLHADYGHYLGQQVNRFIEQYQLHYRVALIASHGHTSFHIPSRKMTAQLGDGAAIAAETLLPVVTDLRSMDIAFGGQGAPIVPIGEKLLLGDHAYFLNLGGIANISNYVHDQPAIKGPLAFDVCPANRVLNMLANDEGMEYDRDGNLASTGSVNNKLLDELDALTYYKQAFPKSLANDFGTDIVYPLIKNASLTTADALRTYVEHITIQLRDAIKNTGSVSREPKQLLATGGGAFNTFLMAQLQWKLGELNIQVVIPDPKLVSYKEALIMAFIGVLRWRQESNVLSSVTGASRDSVGGALWTGQDA